MSARSTTASTTARRTHEPTDKRRAQVQQQGRGSGGRTQGEKNTRQCRSTRETKPPTPHGKTRRHRWHPPALLLPPLPTPTRTKSDKKTTNRERQASGTDARAAELNAPPNQRSSKTKHHHRLARVPAGGRLVRNPSHDWPQGWGPHTTN